MKKNNNLLTTSGKQVSYADGLEKDINLLKSAEKQGYYYPVLAMKQLRALASGPAGKANVFIPDGLNDSRATSLHMFYVLLPGIVATVERRSSDKLIVTALTISDGYKSISKGGAKPGIYTVSKTSGEPQVKYKTNGRIKAEDGRIVVTTEGSYTSPVDAAQDALRRLDKTAGRTASMQGEFDLVYSPIGKRLGGMRNYDPGTNTASFAFSANLANAMIQTQNKKHIHWISEYGGSAILTQAMDVVAQKNISFEGQNHSAYMYKPSTDPTQAVRLAHKLGFQIGDDFAKVSGPRVLASTLITKAVRAKNKDDAYSWKNYSADLAKGGMGGVALAGVGLFAATAFTTTASPSLVAAGTIASGIGAGQLLWTKAKNLLDKS